MKLDNYLIKTLEECAKNHTILVVSGSNGMNWDFEIEGCILLGHNDVPCLSERGIVLFNGQMDIYNEKPIKFYVTLCVHPESDNEIRPDIFYVKNIATKDGKMVFENDDFDNIMARCRRSLRECFRYLVDENIVGYASMILGKPMKNEDGPTVLKCLYYTSDDEFSVVTSNGSCSSSYRCKSKNEIGLMNDNSASLNLAHYSNSKKR